LLLLALWSLLVFDVQAAAKGLLTLLQLLPGCFAGIAGCCMAGRCQGLLTCCQILEGSMHTDCCPAQCLSLVLDADSALKNKHEPVNNNNSTLIASMGSAVHGSCLLVTDRANDLGSQPSAVPELPQKHAIG